MAWFVLCDFDATISKSDVTDTLLEAFAKPLWRELEQDWIEGRIGSRECMQRQVACLDASREELNAVIDTIGVDEGFSAFVDAVAARGWDLSVVSDGIDYSIWRVLRRRGLSALPVYANRLTQTGPRSWQLDFPHADAACAPASGLCKCAFARRARAAGYKTLVVGDAHSDFCVASNADFVFAKDRLITHCLQNHLPHVAITGFDDALRHLDRLEGAEFSYR